MLRNVMPCSLNPPDHLEGFFCRRRNAIVHIQECQFLFVYNALYQGRAHTMGSAMCLSLARYESDPSLSVSACKWIPERSERMDDMVIYIEKIGETMR